MKKRKITLSLLMGLFAVTLGLAGCSVKEGDIFPDYEFTNPPPKEVVYDVDEGVELDGKPQESFWQSEHYWYTGSFSDGSKGNNEIMHGHVKPCEVRVTSHFTEKGAYFIAEMDDDIINVYRQSPLQAYQKTGLSFYVAAPGMVNTSDGTGAYEFVMAVDGSTLFRRHYRGGYRAYPLEGVGFGVSYVDENLDENGNGTAQGYVLEAFIPWSTIKLDEKPEYLNVAFAAERHEDATQTSQFTWEWNPQGKANWYYADTWLKFNENGLYTANAQDKTIDGNGEDWADYTGEVQRLDFADGKRYIEHKMIRGSDGLYVYTEALQKLYITENAWYKNTSIELVVTNEHGNTVSYALDGAGYKADYTQGVMQAEDKQVDGETYKFITAEYFIPDFTLSFGVANKSGDNVDVSAEALRVGVSFVNGSGATLDDGGLDPAVNEVIDGSENIKDTYLSNKPYLFFPYGSNPWDLGKKPYVTSDGITVGAVTQEKTIDGNADDWADYRGITSVAYGRKEGDDVTSLGKGFTVKAVKGADGVYFYATVKHSQWNTVEKDKYDRSNLTLKFSVTDTAYTGVSPNTNGKNGWETYFTSTGNSWGANCAQYMSHSVGADGLHTTVIEGFVPFGYMGLSNYKDSAGNLIFDPITGEVADGYVLRVSFRWRTKGDTAYMQTRNASADWFAGQFALNTPENHYVIDENGLHQSRLVPTAMYIDGKTDDGSDYAGETLKVVGSQTDDVRYAETKAVMCADGLYTLTTAKVKNFVVAEKMTSGANGISATAYKNNSSLEIRYVDSNGANQTFALITPSGASFVTSWVPEIEYEYNVVQEGEYYIVTIEAFFNKNYLQAKTGSETPENLALSFAYYVHDDVTDETSFAPSDYATATAVDSTNGLYYVTTAGLTKELS